MAKGLVGQEEWKLWLNTTQSVNIYRSCSNSSIEFPSEATLLPEQWNYVLVTYDGAMLRFYINGSESGAHAFTKACTDSGQGVRLSSSSGGFSGRMDEMVVYNRALTPNEILTLYNYQSGWIEDRNSQTIVVDNEAPTVSVVITDGVHLPDGWPVVVALDAQDASSGIQSVDLLVSKGGARTRPSMPSSVRTPPKARPGAPLSRLRARLNTRSRQRRPIASAAQPTLRRSWFWSTRPLRR